MNKKIWIFIFVLLLIGWIVLGVFSLKSSNTFILVLSIINIFVSINFQKDNGHYQTTSVTIRWYALKNKLSRATISVCTNGTLDD